MKATVAADTTPKSLTANQVKQLLATDHEPSPSAAFVLHTSSALDESHADVVEAHAAEVPPTLMRVAEPQTKMSKDGSFIVSGTELLGTVAAPSSTVATSVPAGGIMYSVPVNPRYIDGCRIGKFFEIFDQYRIRKITFEYHPVASVLTAGSLVMGYVNDVNDPLTFQTGFAAVRDLYSRSGSAMFNVASGAVCQLGHPLLKWYYTGEQDDPALEFPGMLVVQTTQPLSTAANEPITPFGLVTMSYEFEFLGPSVEGSTALQYFSTIVSMGFSGATATLGNAVTATTAGAAPANVEGVVYWGIIVACDDVAVGSSAWRTWRDAQTGNTITLDVGNIIYWRSIRDASANLRILFASTLSAAITLDALGAGPGCWTNTFGVASGVVRGFKLMNVQGSPIQGFA